MATAAKGAIHGADDEEEDGGMGGRVVSTLVLTKLGLVGRRQYMMRYDGMVGGSAAALVLLRRMMICGRIVRDLWKDS